VTISDGTLTENLVETTPGHYYTSEEYFGEENKTYDLRIEYGGEVYTSTSTIDPVTSIDSVAYDLAEIDEDDEEDEDYVYEPFGIYPYFQEPNTPNQHYLFKLSINGVPYTDEMIDWFFTDDTFVNGNYIEDAEFFNFNAMPGDSVTFEIYSISEAAYDYLNAMLLETEFRGGLFDGAPANVPSNMSNGALGAFLTMDVEKASLIMN